MDLTKLSASGTSEGVYDLAQVVPVKGKADINSESELVMSMGGQKTPMTMKQDLKFSMEAK